ncbi:CtsR family transcriptional regulator [Trichococcus pasteurii]|uniref:Transcriptional regulator CtsR n=1 Tax=Trichococcus pasteurii TaxID=43064 RepID=A0A1W1IHE7_9LACT|nr:CtsR family transcriptional regulator [Trichococcus pasteurii]SFE91458.1 transcriptional regulator CtsR [Trichococcus pasteurii]SLM52223.1 transcriptional repressor of class iii stress genes [Trichococcus pasteurii]SSB93104.1 transcriptional repressor of class iii stress genes [Trichococcus pasteurii]
MHGQNMSDIIEAYIKKILNAEEQIEIRRNEMADRFNCVPSQINYVINTRFTEQQGYSVESKRGGGGYIRIMKVKILDQAELLDKLIAIVGESITQKDAFAVTQNLYSRGIITKREGNLMLSVLDKSLAPYTGEYEERIRALLLRNFLNSLRFE